MSVLIQVSSYKKPLLVLLEYLELRSVFYEMYSISECLLIVNSYSNNVILLVLICLLFTKLLLFISNGCFI